MKIQPAALRAILVALIAVPVMAMADPASGPVCSRLTVFVAKKIYTMNPGQLEAAAVAVCNDKIVSVGNSIDDLKPWTSAIPTAVDRRFADKIVFPGFIDAHQHPLLGALSGTLPPVAYLDTSQAYGPDVKGVRDEAEAFDRLRRYDAEIQDPQHTLVAWGWDVPAMGRHLTRQDLDRISTTRPIVVWDASQHHAYVNSALIAKRKIPADLKIPGVGRDEKGELNGQFLGVPAASYALLPELAERLKPAEMVRLARWSIDQNRRNGITTTTDHSLGLFSVDAEVALYDSVYNRPDTPERLLAIPAMHTFIAKYGRAEKAIEAVRELQARSTDRLIFRGVKFFTDDSFNGLTFKPGAPGYIDGHEGLWVIPPDKLTAAIEPWWKAGLQIFVHSIGVEAQDATLATLQQLQDAKPRFDHRFTLEHLGLLRGDQIRRMKALGASANVNIYYPWLRGESYPGILGTDRAHHLSPLGSLVRAGVPTTVHSDYPIGPPRPLLAITIATTRVGRSGKSTLGAGERVNVDQALRMVTADAAYVLGIDNKVGSIEVGKLADFTVLEKDPHDVKLAEIRNIAVWATVVGGQIYPVADIKKP